MKKINKSNLTKLDISRKINLKTGLPINYSSKLTDDLIDILKNQIKSGILNIKNFATFKIINKKDRIGRNPKNKKVYKIHARKSLSFFTSKRLNDKIRDL